jgi:RNA polymerase sigma-70 factor (ECF subfamily)
MALAIDVEDCYRRYGPMVLRRCRQLLKIEERATEAMQDVFVLLVRKQGRLEDRGLSSLLYRMATNTSLNLIRSRKRRPEDADSDLVGRIAMAPRESGGLASARLMLDRIFSTEQDSTRAMAVMHLVDGYTLEEVAGHFDMSVSGVRKRLRTLKAHVRELEGV